MEHEVRRVDERGRYELYVDGELAGFADFRIDGESSEGGERVVLPHTVIDPHRRGDGLGALLIQGALADIGPTGRKVVPACWYAAQYFDEHPEDADLLA